jgi:hypothetical protein
MKAVFSSWGAIGDQITASWALGQFFLLIVTSAFPTQSA